MIHARRLALLAVVAFALVPALVPALRLRAGERAGSEEPRYFFGKVVPLSDAFGKQGVKIDADAAPYWLVLVTDDGRVLPLIKEPATRLFFSDAKLRNRPVRLTGRLLPKSQLLQAVNVHTVRDGQLHEVYYWCDICSIRDVEGGPCGCCGAPLQFREVRWQGQ
ncbi:MAG: hypothetical protein NZO58_08090 [Gemmataceae bacterium]|nr:hypothetical protein [Gemmataceae bacterium]